jgi:hypothetical protein
MSLTSIPMSAYAQEVQEPSNQEQESQEVVQEEQAESVGRAGDSRVSGRKSGK